MSNEYNPIEELKLEVDRLKRTKQNNIPAGGNSMIITRGNMDGETSVLYRKDVINENSADMLNIPSEIAVTKYISDKLHVQNQQFKCALGKIMTDTKNVVDQETTRAKIAEAELKTMVQVINVDGVKQMIVDETKRATDVEQHIREKIQDEKIRATEAEKTINVALDEEINRSSTKEGELQHAISDEITRAKGAEKGLSDKIDAIRVDIVEAKNAISSEQKRAQCAENTLSSKIDGVNQSANTNYSQIRTDLNSEINRASTAEAAANAAISAEAARAKAEEHRLEQLMKGIDYDEEFQKLKEHVNVTEGVLTKRIDDEINRATNVEGKIQTDLNAEIERASRANERVVSEIATLKKTLSDEIERSTSRDDNISGRLETEITRATTTEDNIYKAIADLTDTTNDVDKETARKLGEFNERLTSSIELFKEADKKIIQSIKDEHDRAVSAEMSNAAAVAAETIRAKDSEDDLHHMIIDEIERSSAEDKRIDLIHKQDIDHLKSANSDLNKKIGDEITRATEAEKVLNETKISKDIAGEDGTVVKNVEFRFADSDYCDKNAKQVEFHKTLLNLMDGKTVDTKEVYDLSIVSGAHDIGLALNAEKDRAMAAEQRLHDLIDRGISDNSVATDVYASNGYKSVSSHEFRTDPTIFGSKFWTKTVTENVKNPSVEDVKEFHFVSDDIDLDITRVTADASIINLSIDKATEDDVATMLNSVFGA